ncbi:hypothetical protein N8T08_007815 [Aspergillus melleus]|uniref:Uncharacterized protein n=1 Tax=Aspergillus melleus TaxID=138277 RepID=A0ACC3AXE3_9EURO|nr:hypothetical protein N8T08_007815 [Aspergillus melleus]
MSSGQPEQFPLPSISRSSHSRPDRPTTSWNPFDPISPSDRSYIRYERAQTPNEEEDVTSYAGLGINNSTQRLVPNRDSRGPDQATPTSDLFSPGFSEQQTLRSHYSRASFVGSDFNATKCSCKTRVVQRRCSWVPITVLVLAIYSTVVSGIYFFVSWLRPRYGQSIGTDGGLRPSTASLLSALFAKTIELAYVSVFVAFLGQFLSRRAIKKGSSGITISDLSMRTWIMQPASMIIHSQALRYSALTLLGMLTLTATIVAMLYTTAAEALVSPKLLQGPYEDRTLTGNVTAKFAWPDDMRNHCETLITNDIDPAESEQDRGNTCLELQHVSQAYHNYHAYLSKWSDLDSQNTSAALVQSERPPPVGTMFDNTTVTGAWIDQTNITDLSKRYGRMVINVTAAMPHGGVAGAVNNPQNGFHRPRISSEGNFDLSARLPSPAVNVLCAGMSRKELSPLIYDLWPHSHFNSDNWTVDQHSDVPTYPSWLNRTVVDDLFRWGKQYDTRPPIFGKLPEEYNTIVNGSVSYGDSLYLLGHVPTNRTPEYVLCSMKAKLSPRCSTHYSATIRGASFGTKCNNPDDKWRYDQAYPDAPDGAWDPDWKNIAHSWALALSLNTGITNGRASNSRVLMQLTPKNDTLDPKAPSIAEALAVMAGNTLILGSANAPFVHFWNYTDISKEPKNATVPSPEQQSFRASVRVVGYQSSYTEKWHYVFYVILGLAFITSAFCLVYMLLIKGRQLTDFTDPQNLFTLAMNSPATSKLDGACGAGPHGEHFKEKWFVGMEPEDEHYYIRTKAEERTPLIPTARFSMRSMEAEDVMKPVTPAIEEYERVSSRRGWLSRWY